jgi:hypothetical protein
MSRVRNTWLGLLPSLAAAIIAVSAWAYDGYGHPVQTYGYSYGPEFNYGYFTSSIFAYGSGDKVHPYRNPGCAILCLDGYWQDITKRRPIAIIKGNRILIR